MREQLQPTANQWNYVSANGMKLLSVEFFHEAQPAFRAYETEHNIISALKFTHESVRLSTKSLNNF